MTTVTLKEAQSALADLIHHLSPGDEVVITENDRPVARLVPHHRFRRWLTANWEL